MSMSFPPMPLLPISSPQTIDKCKSLPLRSSDIFICSYPKSGTTWTQGIVLSLILCNKRYKERGGGGDDIIKFDHVSDYAPFFEIDAHWDINSDTLAENVIRNHNKLGQRIFNTHLRWDMLPKKEEDKELEDNQHQQLRPACGKFIYVTRSLPDVCASFYHHLANQKEGTYNELFDKFASDWMAGNIPFGSPLQHLLSFAEGFSDNRYSNDAALSENNDQPLLLLSYERLKENLRDEVLRIIDFLNLKHISNEVLEKELLPSFEFASMKANSNKFQPLSVTWLNGYQFLRKGVIGDGKKLMMETMVYDEHEKKVSLMTIYNNWIEKKGYCTKIDDYKHCGLANEVAEQFKLVS